MQNKGPADQNKSSSLFGLSQIPVKGFGQNPTPMTQNKQQQQSPSNLQSAFQNTQGQKQLPKDQANTFLVNKQQKSSQPQQKQKDKNVTKKQKPPQTGGVLNKGQQDPKKKTLTIDTTLHFGLQDIIDSIVKGIKIEGRQFDKISKNFKNFIKSGNKHFEIEKITTQIDIKSLNKVKILNLPYLSQIQDKSKITINHFWVSIIQNICQKIPFLSQQACLEIVKLQISMNKNIYCQKGNLGNFDIQLFAKPQLFPIVNNKMQVNTQHQLYIKIRSQILHLIVNLFKALNGIFKQMTLLQVNQDSKYNQIFSIFKEKQEKRKILINLFQSFFLMMKFTPQEKFVENISYFQSVVDSIWYFYLGNQNAFQTQICKDFLIKLNQNYNLFNQSDRIRSISLKKLINCVEKVSINFLLSYPFNYKKWDDKDLKNLILESNLQMLEPFKMILPQNRRNERRIRICDYETRGYHWKQFIQILIKLEQDQEETVEFLIKSIKAFLTQNSHMFWNNPAQFQTFYRFTTKLLNRKSNQFNKEEIKDKFLQILGIGSKLMGGQEQNQFQNHKSTEIYPDTKVLPFSLEVDNEFSQYFMGMNRKEFLEIIGSQIAKMIQENKENERQKYGRDVEMNLRREILVKQYLLKLVSSDPNFIFTILKIDSDISQQQIIDFLIISTITNSSLPSNIIDSAFAALDRMLLDPKSCKFIEKIIFFDSNKAQLSCLVDILFQNFKALPFIARHCGVLINLNYQQKEWTKLLLNKFYEISVQEGRIFIDAKSQFARSYYQLLSGILSVLGSRDGRNVGLLRKYINISFIIESLKYYLKFDFHRGEYVNIAVCEQNGEKLESFFECVRLYNIILLYELKFSSISIEDKLQSNTLRPFYLPSSKQYQILTPIQAKGMGINDQEFYLQVRSLKNQTTSYLNALSFIIVNSTPEQKTLIKEINYNYQNLIFQTIQSLAKINQKSKLKSHFCVKNIYQPILNQKTDQLKGDEWCLKKFISCVETCLNESGIQVIMFGQLLEKTERLRILIDKVRIKLQNPKIRDRMASRLIFKIISTLSRYFRDSMAGMALNKDKESNFDSLEIRDHFQFLLQTILEFVVGSKSNSQPWQQVIISNVLNNIYGGFLRIQAFNGGQYLKFLKNFHPILLNSINLFYLVGVSPQVNGSLYDPRDQSQNKYNRQSNLSQDYFKILQLFLNCEQYLSDEQFKIISGIRQLPERVSNFILVMAKYSQFSKLSSDFVDILLQILVSGVSFYISIVKSQQQKISFLSELYDVLLSQKQQIKTSINFVLLQLLILNQLSIAYSYDDLLIQNQDILSLQIISAPQQLPLKILEQLISKLKNFNLNNMAFLSIANGLFTHIQNSEISTALLKPLIQVYNQLLRNTHSYQISLSKPSFNQFSVTTQTNQTMKVKNINSPFKKVWMLQLILAILTDIQTNSSSQKIQKQKQFLNFIIQNDSILTRFGYLMKKIAFHESQTYLPWISFFQEQIANELCNKNQVTFVQKLELNQLMKIFSFLFANTDWNSNYMGKHIELISNLVQYRKIFQKICFSNKKHIPLSSQEKILEGISLNSLLSTQQISGSSGQKQFERQRISGDVLKSSSSFDLLHEVMNFDLSVQYSLLCASIGLTFCTGLGRKFPEIADTSKWNTLFLDYTQALVQKYIKIITNQSLLQKILKKFSEIYNGDSKHNINLSKQMLFTNSSSLSSSLNVTFQSWKDLLIQTLSLYFENIYIINKKLQTQLHSDFKIQQQRFVTIIASLKKHDKQNFDFGMYDPKEQKNKINQTMRSNINRSYGQSQIFAQYSATIRNY